MKGKNIDIVAIKNAMDIIFSVVTHDADRKNIQRYVKTAIKELKQNTCDESTDADISFLGLDNVIEYIANDAYASDDIPF